MKNIWDSLRLNLPNTVFDEIEKQCGELTIDVFHIKEANPAMQNSFKLFKNSATILFSEKK